MAQRLQRRGPHPGIPEWEAMKGNCRNLPHHEAVEEAEYLRQLYRDRLPSMSSPVELKQILRTLAAKKIPFVLTGAHGIAGWTGRPRSTKDVDLLVKSGRNHARAVQALREIYPSLDVRKLPCGTAFAVPGEQDAIIDVMCDVDDGKFTQPVMIDQGGEQYRVPSLEKALADKFAAMRNSSRDIGQRGLDAVDFSYMVKHAGEKGRQPIDMERLAALGELVWPGDGGEEIVRMVEQVRAGKIPNVMKRIEPA